VVLRSEGIVADQRANGSEVHGAERFIGQRVIFPPLIGTTDPNGHMTDDPKQPEPEIMPPVPEVGPEPRRGMPEIPPDKDAPERKTPVKGEE
jgi:hypothetical protein